MLEMETFMVGCSETTNFDQKTNHCSAILLFNETERKTAEDVVHRMVKRAVEMEGTVTGEHGVGLIKRDYLEHELGRNAVDAMRKVSRIPSRASM
jgi:FAD/FMN-containing dehydrogenase